MQVNSISMFKGEAEGEKLIPLQRGPHKKIGNLMPIDCLLYTSPTFTDLLNLVDEPLGQLPESVTRPPKSALDGLMASLQH